MMKNSILYTVTDNYLYTLFTVVVSDNYNNNMNEMNIVIKIIGDMLIIN